MFVTQLYLLSFFSLPVTNSKVCVSDREQTYSPEFGSSLRDLIHGLPGMIIRLQILGDLHKFLFSVSLGVKCVPTGCHQR